MTSSQPERNFDDLLLLLQNALREHLARPSDRQPLRQALQLLAEIDLHLGPNGPRDVLALCQQMLRLVGGLAQGLLNPSEECAYLLARAALEIPPESEINGSHHDRPLKLLTRELQALRDDYRRTGEAAAHPSPPRDTARSTPDHTTYQNETLDASLDKPDTRKGDPGKESRRSHAAISNSRESRNDAATAPACRSADTGSQASTGPQARMVSSDNHEVRSLSKQTCSPQSTLSPSTGLSAAEKKRIHTLDLARHRFQTALLLVCRESDARAAAGELTTIAAEIAAALPGTGCSSLFEGTKRLAADIVRTGAEPSPPVKRLLGRVDRQFGQCLRSFRQLSDNTQGPVRNGAWKVPADLIIAVREAVAAPGNMATASSDLRRPANDISRNARTKSMSREQPRTSGEQSFSFNNQNVAHDYSNHSELRRPVERHTASRRQPGSTQKTDTARQPEPFAAALRLTGRLASRLEPLIVFLVLAPFRLLLFSGGLLAYAVKGILLTGWLVVQGIGEILYLTATSLVRITSWTMSGIAAGAIWTVRGIARGLFKAAHAISRAIAFVVRGTAHGVVVTASGLVWVLSTASREIAYAVSDTTRTTINGTVTTVRGIARGLFKAAHAISRTIAFVVSGTAHGVVVTASGLVWVLSTASREIASAVSDTTRATINGTVTIVRISVRGLLAVNRGSTQVAAFLVSGTRKGLSATSRWMVRSASSTADSVIRTTALFTGKLHRSLSGTSRHIRASLHTGILKSAQTVHAVATAAAQAAIGLAGLLKDLPTLPRRTLASAGDGLATLAATLVLRLWAGSGLFGLTQVGWKEQDNGLRLSSFVVLVFLAPGKLLKFFHDQLLRLLSTGRPDHDGSTYSAGRNAGSGYRLPGPALALAFLGGLGVSAMTISMLHEDPTVVSGTQPRDVSVRPDIRLASCDVPGQHREPAPRPSTHAANECPPATERLGADKLSDHPILVASDNRHGRPIDTAEDEHRTSDRPAETNVTSTPLVLASLLGLDGSMGADLVTVARQAARDGLASAGSFNSFETDGSASPDNGAGLAPLLGLNGHLGATLVSAAWLNIAEHGGLALGHEHRPSYPAAKPDSTNTLASLTGLDGEFGKELASKARQALQSHRTLTPHESPGQPAIPANTSSAIRLASLLGPNGDLASALVAAASATTASPTVAITSGDVPQLPHSIPSTTTGDAPRLVSTRASDPDRAPGADLAFAVWEPSVEEAVTARPRARSRNESRRAATTMEQPRLAPASLMLPEHGNGLVETAMAAPLKPVSYTEVNTITREMPNISQALEIASIGPFLPDLISMPLSATGLSADDRDPGQRVEASLEGNYRLLPTSYQMLDLDLDPARPTGLMWSNHTLREGDSIAALWSSVWKLPSDVLYGILADSESALSLNRVHPGQEVAWQTDTDGDITRLRLWHDRLSGTEWVLNDNGRVFARKEVKKTREIQHIALSAHVDEDIAKSLAARAELSASAARSLAILLERHLPMHDEKVRPGDRFALVIEQEMIEGDDTPYEVRLLAFDYHGEKINLTALRNTDGRFYTPDGKSLLPAFERTPFTGSHRVSSAYNLRRRHPVTGRTAPHHGTDFAMPVGTPILAPANGKVTHVQIHPHAGRYLVVEHGQGYTTRYLHLQRTFVRSGQTVKRGERIALSGNTGRTTGPHLHYELHVDGVPVDAMRAELPAAESLAGIRLEQFQNNAQPLLAALRNADPSQQVAMRPFPSSPER